MRIWVLLLTGLALLLCGCSSRPDTAGWTKHVVWSSRTRFTEWGPDDKPDGSARGLGVGFLRPEDQEVPPLQRTSTHRFDVRAGDRFSTLLVMTSNAPDPYPVLVSVFLDYRQVEFRMDGRQGLLHYVEIPPDVDLETPIEVPIEGAGWHDLFVVVFRSPGQHPEAEGSRVPPHLAVGGRRTVVCSGSCTPVPTAPTDLLTGQPVEGHIMNVWAFALFANDSRPPGHRLLLVSDEVCESQYELELWASNPSEEMRDYLVISLMDYRQVVFDSSSVLHLRMPPASQFFVSGRVLAPLTPGMHEFQFISIADPYRDLDKVSFIFVYSVMRSGIRGCGDR